MSAERSRRLLTPAEKKTKKQRSQPTVESQESDRRTRKSSKVESTYWRFFTSQVFRLTLHVTVVLYCSLDSHYTKRATPDTCAARPIRAWRLERREASCACVVLVIILLHVRSLQLRDCPSHVNSKNAVLKTELILEQSLLSH